MEISFELARRISNWLWINGIDSPLDLTGEIKE